MESEKFCAWARCDRVGAALIVAKLHERNTVVQLLNDRTDLPARKPLRRQVRQQRYHVKSARPFVFRSLCCSHHSTQHVTNVGQFSPVRTIQIDLTTALFSCRLIEASIRH